MKLLAWLTGSKLVKGQWQGLGSALRLLRPQVGKIDDFATVVQDFGLTSAKLRQQYQQRRIIAYILILLWLALLLLSQLMLSVLVGLLYLNNSLRLYQLRHCILCSVKHYFQAIRTNWHEVLPQALPNTWRVGL